MARDASLLSSNTPTTIAPASVLIGHIQLRDLIICPRERGVVNYVHHHSIMEHNLRKPDVSPSPLVNLTFQPNTLTSLPIDGTDDILLAAGGQEAEVHLSYLSPVSARQRQGVVWQMECTLTGSINNSVLLTSMSLTRSHESSIEPRIGISNNDSTVKFYNVPLRAAPKRGLDEVGCLRLHVPVNHSSISPDGRTLLSVGDSSKVFLHQMNGGSRITFSPIATLKLPSPGVPPSSYISSSLMASFSTSFSADGSKFAVASQEGLLAVWDVRSTKPLKIFETDKSRQARSAGNGEASGWVSDEIYDWSGSSFRAPGWSVRNVKFGGSGDKEIMTFTEHTSLLHVVDARTFEREQIVRVPTVRPKATSEEATTPVQQSPSVQLPVPHPHPRHNRAHYILSPPHRVTSASPPPPRPSPRRQSQSHSHIVQALGDTFRISSPYSAPESISDSTWRALRGSDPMRPASSSIPTSGTGRGGDLEEEYDGRDILVIPHLGDSALESDVQALLGSHGIRSRQARRGALRHGDEERDEDEDGNGNGDDTNTGSAVQHAHYEYTPRRGVILGSSLNGSGGSRRARRIGGGGGYEDEMEVDELESECSSCAPSRSTSPSPSTVRGGGGGRVSSPLPLASVRGPEPIRCAANEEQQVTYVEDLDIAGTCFDPSGRFVYVAATEAVVEWGIRGSEKRWWSGTQWM